MAAHLLRSQTPNQALQWTAGPERPAATELGRSAAEGLRVWHPFDNGATLGRPGSEGGVTVRDEEYEAGARATLERDCGSAPWTVTCGVYGWFFHTRFLGSEAEAEFPAMLAGLAAILDGIPRAGDPEADGKMGAVSEAIERFVARFP